MLPHQPATSRTKWVSMHTKIRGLMDAVPLRVHPNQHSTSLADAGTGGSFHRLWRTRSPPSQNPGARWLSQPLPCSPLIGRKTSLGKGLRLPAEARSLSVAPGTEATELEEAPCFPWAFETKLLRGCCQQDRAVLMGLCSTGCHRRTGHSNTGPLCTSVPAAAPGCMGRADPKPSALLIRVTLGSPELAPAQHTAQREAVPAARSSKALQWGQPTTLQYQRMELNRSLIEGAAAFS